MRVLLVEDDPDQLRLLQLIVEAAGHAAVCCRTLAEARMAPYCELSLIDRGLPDGDALDFALSLRGKVMLLTGAEGDSAGLPVLLKPVSPDELRALLA
ncbi:MAG: hypothetical protein AAGD14_10280 [Planctomycetota bacterium]